MSIEWLYSKILNNEKHEIQYMSFNAYVPFVLAIESTRQYSLSIVWVDCIIAIKWFIDTATRISAESKAR